MRAPNLLSKMLSTRRPDVKPFGDTEIQQDRQGPKGIGYRLSASDPGGTTPQVNIEVHSRGRDTFVSQLSEGNEQLIEQQTVPQGGGKESLHYLVAKDPARVRAIADRLAQNLQGADPLNVKSMSEVLTIKRAADALGELADGGRVQVLGWQAIDLAAEGADGGQ